MRRRFLATGFVVVAGGCASLLSIEDPRYADAPDAGRDAPEAEGAIGDGPVPPLDAAAEADADGGVQPVYNDVTDPQYWTSLNIGLISAPVSGLWLNAVFDGRYVHFLPATALTPTLSFDPHGDFETAAFWRIISTPFDGGGDYPLAGGASLGAELAMVALGRSTDPDLLFHRTGAAPVDAGWAAVDLIPIEPIAGHGSPATDGRYLYLPPSLERATSNASNQFVRFDPSTPDAAPLIFNGATLNNLVAGYTNAVFDGRFLYFVPAVNYLGYSGVVARFDTTKPFLDPLSWQTFDLQSGGDPLANFRSATFDGRYVYMFTYSGSPLAPVVVRYDTTRTFRDIASWQSLPLRQLNLGADAGAIDYVAGSAFDGRYVYALLEDLTQGVSAALVRLDSSAPFTLSSFQVARLPDVLRLKPAPPQVSFSGVAFDGEYLYLGPFVGGVVGRFHARAPGAPPTFGGSSF